jgi:hypothetical protein
MPSVYIKLMTGSLNHCATGVFVGKQVADLRKIEPEKFE